MGVGPHALINDRFTLSSGRRNVRGRPGPGRTARERRRARTGPRHSRRRQHAEAAQAARVSQLWPDVRLSIGVHPHQAHEFAGDPGRAAEIVRRQAQNTPSARAIGEIGLDYHYDFSPPDVQQRVFRAQLDVAREMDWPVVIHTREADEDTLRILKEEGGGKLRGVLHCFSGTQALADAGLALGFYISLAGIVTFPKAQQLRDTARARPARTTSDGDRQSVPGAGAAPRQAQRTGPRRLRGRRLGRAAWNVGR